MNVLPVTMMVVICQIVKFVRKAMYSMGRNVRVSDFDVFPCKKIIWPLLWLVRLHMIKYYIYNINKHTSIILEGVNCQKQ